jgi:hypothetical protein
MKEINNMKRFLVVWVLVFIVLSGIMIKIRITERKAERLYKIKLEVDRSFMASACKGLEDV